MGTNLTDDQLEAALCALAIVDAAIDHDNRRVDLLLEPWTDAAPIVQYLLWLVERSLDALSGGDPHVAVEQFRRQVLTAITEKGDPS